MVEKIKPERAITTPWILDTETGLLGDIPGAKSDFLKCAGIP